MKLETAVELFSLRMRGAIALMYDFRGVEPSEQAWAVLRGETDPSLRDMSNIAFDLGFTLGLSTAPSEEPREI